MMQKHPVRAWLGSAAVVAAVLAAIWLAVPAPTQAGFKLFKAKESQTSFMSGGQQIKVWTFTPSEGDGPFPGIVLLHGLDGIDLLEKDKSIQLLYKTVAGKIADKGFVVHLEHYFHRTPMTEKDIADVKQMLLAQVPNMKDRPFDLKLKKLYEDWTDTVDDGLAFLRKDKKLVDPERIGMVGLSLGGFLVTSLLVERPQLNVCAVVNVFGGLPPQQYDMALKAKKLPPLLVMGGEEDDIVPIRFQRELYALWCTADSCREAHFYGNVGHAFFDKTRGAIDTDLALNEALPTAIRFLKRHVQK